MSPARSDRGQPVRRTLASSYSFSFLKKQKTPVLLKGRGHRIPCYHLFSRCAHADIASAGTVIPWHDNGCCRRLLHTADTASKAKLQDVIHDWVSCASHHPAALCRRTVQSLLALFLAFTLHGYCMCENPACQGKFDNS